MKRILHQCIEIDFLLDEERFPDELLAGLFKRDGVPMSAADIRSYLREEKDAGKEVLPLTACDKFDFKRGCPGHEVED